MESRDILISPDISSQRKRNLILNHSSSESPAGSTVRKKIARQVSNIWRAPKYFNDNVHGEAIKFNSVLLKIIDTAEFQRLRELKQLGTCSYVFPAANHNRLQHSLGVAHLAEKFTRNLQKNISPYFPPITENDVLCVSIAGLCHDIGHG